MSDKATAEDMAALALADKTTSVLLNAAYSLTHRIHAAEAKTKDWRVSQAPEQSEIDDLRAQRDLLGSEIERRVKRADEVLIEAADLLDRSRSGVGDRSLAMSWGKRRKALLDQAIDAGWKS